MLKSVFLFHTSSAAMWAQRKIKEAGLPGKLASVPRDLSSDCGYCIITDTSQKEVIAELLKNNTIEIAQVVDHDL